MLKRRPFLPRLRRGLYSVSFWWPGPTTTPPAFFFSLFSFKSNVMKNANDQLRDFIGTTQWYRHSVSGYLFTDGVKALADQFRAYWLIDLVMSHQLTPEVKRETFQTWKLKRQERTRFVAVATDGNKREIARQEIPFSDFDADSATLLYCDGVLLLPSEY
jgi:hypothetical protein